MFESINERLSRQLATAQNTNQSLRQVQLSEVSASQSANWGKRPKKRQKKAKFNEGMAMIIRMGHQNGCSYRDLARLYETDKNTVMAICRYTGAYRRSNWVNGGN